MNEYYEEKAKDSEEQVLLWWWLIKVGAIAALCLAGMKCIISSQC